MPFVIQWIEQCNGDEQVSRVQTPVGNLFVYTRQEVICATDWVLDEGLDAMIAQGFYESETARMIEQYFSNPEQLLPVKLLRQGSSYRHRVWHELNQIPFGTTISYSSLAKNIRSAARAVGNACRDNPYPFLIPCHRVVSATGAGGYCGQTQGDLMAIKLKLLAFEANYKI